jgi:hypothetical protein
VRAGTQNEIQQRANRTPPGNIISVPIFDQFSTQSFEDCQNSYHIVELGCMSLEGWYNANGQRALEYVDGRNGQCWSGKLIEVAVSCGFCNSECGGTIGGPPVAGGVNAVSLIQ